MLNPLRQLASQTAIYGLSSILGRFLNYLLVPLFTRIFLPDEYGVVTELYAYAGILWVLFTYGLETAYFRFASKGESPERVFSTAMISVVTSSFFIVTGLLFFSDSIAAWLEYPDQAVYIQWFALILGADSIAAIPFASLRRSNKATSFALLKLLNIGVNIGLNLFFLLFCPYVLASTGSAWEQIVNAVYDPSIGVGYIFISNLLASTVTAVALIPASAKIRFGFDRKLWLEMLSYSLPLLLVGLAGVINEMLDRALLKQLLPGDLSERMTQLGIYGACYKLSILMTLLIQSFRLAAEPFFFERHGTSGDKELYADIMHKFVLVCSFLFLLVLLFLDIFKHFIGANYHEGLPVVSILLMANLALGIYFNLSIWYKLTDLTRYGAYIALGGAAITVILNIWWIPIYGYIGSAWATLFCYTGMVIASYLFGKKHFPVNYDLSRIGFYIGFALLIYGISSWIPATSLWWVWNTLLLLLYTLVVLKIESRKARASS